MGNFSRNTFNPSQRYVSVRLQQGVPLIDADWNELSDVTRQEAYNIGELAVPDGVDIGFGFSVGAANNPVNQGGSGCVDGRRFTKGSIVYDTQRWRNAANAAADGVAVIPALTTPTANRTDMCFLDVWEREVGRLEDGNIVNPAIDVETCVRLRREVALRIAEGTGTLPVAPTGHRYLALARLNRPAGSDTILPQHREDLIPRLNVMSFAPAFEPYIETIQVQQSWALVRPSGGRLHALRRINTSEAEGILPIHLPAGARLQSVRLTGRREQRIDFRLTRWALAPGTTTPSLTIGDLTIVPSAGAQDFDQTFTLPPSPLPFGATETAYVIDNARYFYGLVASSRTAVLNQPDYIYGISIGYSF